jgi:hypothetical protein
MARGYRVSLSPMSSAPPEFVGSTEQKPPVVTHDEPGYLAWRYADHPTHRYLLLELTRRGRLAAWAIVRTRESAAEVQDAAWVSSDPALPRALWWLLPGSLRRRGMSTLTVSCAGGTDVEPSLRRSLYFERAEDRKLVVYLHAEADQGLRDELGSERNWRLFAGELDI